MGDQLNRRAVVEAIATADGETYAALESAERDNYDALADAAIDTVLRDEALHARCREELTTAYIDQENQLYEDGKVDGYRQACRDVRDWLASAKDEARMDAKAFQALDRARRWTGELESRAMRPR